MPRYRIVFMGSSQFAIPALQKLATKHEICAVYTQPTKPSGRGMKPTAVPVAAYANNKSLPLLSPASLAHDYVQKQLYNHNADLYVVVAYGLLLPKTVLDIPKLGCINGHASLLPRWRGAAPIQHAIAAGDTQTGISAILMDENLDTGKVLEKRTCDIHDQDTAGSLHDKLAKLNAEILDNVTMNFTNLLDGAESQNHKQASYAKKFSSQDAEIDWSRSTADLDCHIRAFTPFPGAWCQGPKGRLRILKACPSDNKQSIKAPAGTLIKANKSSFQVATGDGILLIEQVQPEGKKPMSASDFLNGYRLTIGQSLATKTN